MSQEIEEVKKAEREFVRAKQAYDTLRDVEIKKRLDIMNMQLREIKTLKPFIQLECENVFGSGTVEIVEINTFFGQHSKRKRTD